MCPQKAAVATAAHTLHLPFLYQTKTILRLRPRPRILQKRFRASHRRCASTTSNPGPRNFTDYDPPPESNTLSFLKAKAADTSSRNSQTPKLPTSITPRERRVFDNIFTSIAGKPVEKETQPSHSEREKELDHASILGIFSSAVADQKKALGEAVSNKERAAQSVLQEHKQRIDRYPQPLRKAARRAVLSAAAADAASSSKDVSQDLTIAVPDHSASTNMLSTEESDSDDKQLQSLSDSPISASLAKNLSAVADKNKPSSPWSLEDEQVPEANEARDLIDEDQRHQDLWGEDLQDRVIKISQAEMQRISDTMKQSIEHGQEDDFGIWKVCLEDIFPMVDLLKPADPGRDNDPGQAAQLSHGAVVSEASPKEKSAAGTEAVPRRTRDRMIIPEDVPPLTLLTTLYPSALLLALRLLIAHYPTSPLCLALLPHVRSLGPMSYVLGASVHFYNALLKLMWEVYSDLGGIDRLLTDMERGGVEFDTTTWRLLDDVEWERWQDVSVTSAGGEDNNNTLYSSRGRIWWARPGPVRHFAKIREWKRIVAQRLVERGLGEAISEREYGDDDGGDSGDDDDDTAEVVGDSGDGPGPKKTVPNEKGKSKDKMVWL